MEFVNNLRQLYSEKDVTRSIIRMGNEIISSEINNIVFIMILKGGVYTGMRLLEYLGSDISYGFLGLNSYIGESINSSGQVYCTYSPIFEDGFLFDKNVWVVDDVVQTGRTMMRAKKFLKVYSPRSVSICVLVDKSESQMVKPDIVGFRYEGGKFIVGCGMGLGERYRNLQYICEYQE